jgi:hypothetical protein
MHSPTISQSLYPELTFDKRYPKNTGLPNFRMLDEATYEVPDGSVHSLFAEVPRYQLPITDYRLPKITSQTSESDMIFTATVGIPPNCTECIVILKQTYHPSWTATVDGKTIKPFTVFPFYTAISINDAGTHEVVFSYKPSTLKIVLLCISLITIGGLIWLARPNGLKKIKARP